MIVCCIDTNRAHVVPGAATAPLETLAESADEVCDARRARIDDAALAFEDEAGCVLRGAAAMAALERRCRFRYVETLAFLHERHLRQRHLLVTPAAPSPEALFGGDFDATPALVVRPTPPLGLGVFAGEPIAPGALVAEYAAVARPPDGGTARAFDGYGLHYGESLGGESLDLSALHYGNVGRFFNHDAELQNADLVGCAADGGLFRVVVVSLRAIPEGDQVLVDYGRAYWAGAPFDPVPAVVR